MKFNYETQGAITYLVCELENTEQIDTLTLGMLTNNHIFGLAPILYTEMNGQRFLKYNVSAKVSSEQFFSGNMKKHRTLLAFNNILTALCSADEYMIEQNCFSMLPEHVFLNVSNCETSLICIPVITEKDINAEVTNLFKKIMFSTQFDSTEDATYITQLITYINNSSTFSVYGLKDLVDNLQKERPATQNVANPAMQTPTFSNSTQQSSAPVSSFDSTISIDDMPGMMVQKQPMQQPAIQQSPVKNVAVPNLAQSTQTVPQQKKSQPVQPVAQGGRPINNGNVPAMNNPVHPNGGSVNNNTSMTNSNNNPVVAKPANPPMGRPINNAGTPNFNNSVPQGKPQQPSIAIPKAPAQNNANFAIPGQSPKNNAPAQNKPINNQPTQQSNNEKKISLFGLLAHYNKENVELYKKQKEAKKVKNTKTVSAPQKPINVGNNPIPNGVPVTPPQTSPTVQPLPVQNSFNETTVLSAFSGGETTVLSANTGISDPYLTRVKTGERIMINKPVFRIGKEKSYVDYFIGDNTAISRSHANIHKENGGYFIEDTNSTNHTYVNGTIINSNVKTKLSNGDKIRLANEDFTFSI